MITASIVAIISFALFVGEQDSKAQLKQTYEIQLDRIQYRCIDQIVCDCLPVQKNERM